ncbi:hypothetical protein AVEN_5828-1 [Araneus ventricosus]|uniref:Uncharacterized protein n=1 Tax=Araneus ventricosus TaxID=182803 RepID=A0A4Y2RNZ0_ARAVE|nr:hypothetical protein AVEN_5828-1 [Araneus ventricosus]
MTGNPISAVYVSLEHVEYDIEGQISPRWFGGVVCLFFYDEYRRRTHRKKTADDKGKESKMVSEAKPGIAGIRALDASAYRRRIEAETTAQSQARRERYAEAHHLVRNRQSQRIRDEAIHFIEAQV